MNVLAFDTCFSACSAAVLTSGADGTEHSFSRMRSMQTGHAEALMPMIRDVMAEANIPFASLDRIVVTNGPGTFTGVRTGVAAARALALATGTSVVAVSSLWAIAAEAAARLSDQEFDAVLAVKDARKGQLYAEVSSRDGVSLTGPLLLDVDATAGLCPEHRLLLTGDLGELPQAAERQTRRCIVDPACTAEGSSCHPHAKLLLQAAGKVSIGNRVAPLYLRPPDAKPQADKSLPWSSSA